MHRGANARPPHGMCRRPAFSAAPARRMVTNTLAHAGMAILRRDHSRAPVRPEFTGVAHGTRGRRGHLERDDYTNLRGMGDIRAAPAAKLFATYVLSKKFPLILRVDARQILGGADGTVGDAGLYIPLPGSSKKFVMFAGPSVTFGTHH